MAHTLLNARLTGRRLLAPRSQTHLLTFTLDEDFHFTPGQFVSVVLGKDTHAYSLADAPHENQIQLCLGQAGEFSSRLLDLVLNDEVQLHGPHGKFIRRNNQEPSLYFAAGIGIVPIRSIFRNGVPARSTLVHIAEARDEFLFRDEFGHSPNSTYLPFMQPAPEFLDTQLRRLLGKHPEIQTAYLCGLKNDIQPVRDLLRELGWDDSQIVYERFD